MAMGWVLNPDALVALSIASVGAVLGFVTLLAARPPHARAMQRFAACALLASGYCIVHAINALSTELAVLVACTQATIALAGLNGAAWCAYLSAREDRSMTRFERALVFGVFVAAGVMLVPRLGVSTIIAERHFAVLHTTYREAVPTAVGLACCAYDCVALVVLLVHWRRRSVALDRAARRHVYALWGLVAAGVYDSFVAPALSTPYVVHLAFGVLLLSLGSSLAATMVARSQDLARVCEAVAVTDRRLAQRERQAALGRVSGAVAQQLRGPLEAIGDLLGTLRRAHAEPEARDPLLARLSEEANAMNRIVSELLLVARDPSVAASLQPPAGAPQPGSSGPRATR